MLAKSKLNSAEALISKALIDWNISYNEFVLINNANMMIRKTNKKFEKLKQCIEDFSLFIKQWYRILF